MNLTKFQKIAILILLKIIILLLFLTELNNILIDKYNFQQLEKAKIILSTISKDAKKFYTLEEFNEQYKSGILSSKNCYYLSNENGNYAYIFGFKLESLFYRIKYLEIYYSYPKYDLPIKQMCLGSLSLPGMPVKSECYDKNKRDFKYIVSNPCKK